MIIMEEQEEATISCAFCEGDIYDEDNDLWLPDFPNSLELVQVCKPCYKHQVHSGDWSFVGYGRSKGGVVIYDELGAVPNESLLDYTWYIVPAMFFTEPVIRNSVKNRRPSSNQDPEAVLRYCYDNRIDVYAYTSATAFQIHSPRNKDYDTFHLEVRHVAAQANAKYEFFASNLETDVFVPHALAAPIYYDPEQYMPHFDMRKTKKQKKN